jgi:GGDEF domain-containing protein
MGVVRAPAIAPSSSDTCGRVIELTILTKIAETHGPVSRTVSIGATAWHDGDTKVDRLLARADAALYAAKAAGRDCVKVAA